MMYDYIFYDTIREMPCEPVGKFLIVAKYSVGISEYGPDFNILKIRISVTPPSVADDRPWRHCPV